MADKEDFGTSVTRQMRGFVDMMQQEIEDLPFLARFQKQGYIDMLDEARRDLGEARRDARTAVREHLCSVAERLRLEAGKHPNVDKFFSRLGWD